MAEPTDPRTAEARAFFSALSKLPAKGIRPIEATLREAAAWQEQGDKERRTALPAVGVIVAALKPGIWDVRVYSR